MINMKRGAAAINGWVSIRFLGKRPELVNIVLKFEHRDILEFFFLSRYVHPKRSVFIASYTGYVVN